MPNPPKKILMIGNSFSICVLRWLPHVLGELGAKADVASLYIGGCPLMRHVANLAAAGYGGYRPYLVTWHYDSAGSQDSVPFAGVLERRERDDGRVDFYGNIPAMLAADSWDVVTIQQASHDSWRWETYVPWADVLVDCIRSNAPQASIVVQETWSYCNGDRRISDGAGGPGSWGIDQAGMYGRLAENYARLAGERGFEVVPTGDAVQLYRERRPVSGIGEDVVGSMRPDETGALVGDSIHLNGDGVYLQACVWAAKLFGVDVTRLADTSTPSESLPTPEMAPLMRKCAMDAAVAARDGFRARSPKEP